MLDRRADVDAAGRGATLRTFATDEAFLPPLSTLPSEVQATIRQSNEAKVPNVLMLYPFLGKQEGPLRAGELSARFGGTNAAATEILRNLHQRMTPFDIWKNVRLLVSVYAGTGSRGMFCEPFNHDSFLEQMQRLTTGPEIVPAPLIAAAGLPLRDSRFCRDAFHVHGPRDSFREMVKQGPGLHICITRPTVRAREACDLHIDQVQQGQVCIGGTCVPIVNGQTIRHLQAAGPWLIEKVKEWLSPLLRRQVSATARRPGIRTCPICGRCRRAPPPAR